jgi:hypothetical protein
MRGVLTTIAREFLIVDRLWSGVRSGKIGVAPGVPSGFFLVPMEWFTSVQLQLSLPPAVAAGG